MSWFGIVPGNFSAINCTVRNLTSLGHVLVQNCSESKLYANIKLADAIVVTIKLGILRKLVERAIEL